MRRSLFAFLLLGSLASSAGGEERIVVAQAGECAGDERDLSLPLLPKDSAANLSAPAYLLLSPLIVAAAAGGPSSSPPALAGFGGPGACDNPGSGCLPEKLVDDPDPGTGCGFPGSPCP